jgi:hypothetical protein
VSSAKRRERWRPRLNRSAFSISSPHFSHRDGEIERALGKGAVGVDEFETRRAARCDERIPFMGIAVDQHRSREIERKPPSLDVCQRQIVRAFGTRLSERIPARFDELTELSSTAKAGP